MGFLTASEMAFALQHRKDIKKRKRPRLVDLYTAEEKEALRYVYLKRGNNYKSAADKCNWSRAAALQYLRAEGIIRAPVRLTEEEIQKVRKLSNQGLGRVRIARALGWTESRVQSVMRRFK